MRQRCTLTLSDGESSFTGDLIGAPLTSSGELVFTTGMVGYTEAITDPSYFGQILTFTYPLIGNYGIPPLPDGLKLPIPRAYESGKAQAAGVIISSDSPDIFHWNSLHTLDQWLKQQNVPGIVGIDTRHLVHIIREGKNALGKVTPENANGQRWMGDHLPAISTDEFFDPSHYEILPEVSVREPVRLGSGTARIGLVDCGVKWNIIRQLVELDCEVEVLPWDYDLEKVDCSGWLISNGPGDPKKTGDLTARIAKLITNEQPLLGICLGHQLVCIAAGCTTRRMPYGHRSHNQPVYEVGTRRGYITSQNHGYVVEKDPLPEDWQPWFLNVNDDSIEGLRHVNKPVRTVQFHPEAAGGPRDTGWILEQFIAEVVG